MTIIKQQEDLRRENEVLRRRLVEAEESLRAARESAEIDRGKLAVVAVLIDNIAQGVIIADRHGRVLSMNPAALRLHGFSSPAELQTHAGRYTTDYEVRDRDGRRLPLDEWPLVRVASGETVSDAEIQVRNVRTGQQWIGSFNGIPVRDGVGQIAFIVVTIHDLTDLKRGADELQRAKAAAEDANVAKSQFLANMSHEIRTPMSAILGMTELALGEPLSPSVRDYLQMARESAEMLMELLNEILDLSRIEAGRFEFESMPFSLRKTVEQVVKPQGIRASEKNLNLLCEVAADVPDRVIGDPLRLRQVLTNLVGNAIKFTQRGQIVVRVGKVDRQEMPDQGLHEGQRADRIANPPPPIPASQSAISGLPSPIRDPQSPVDTVTLKVCVADTGIGISPEQCQRIFAPFTQADASTTRRFGGTGLGLNISQQLVELMGGRIWVTSQVEQGSTFCFTARLKLQEEPIAAAEGPDRPARMPLPVPSRPLRVLLAEDTPANQKLVTRILARRGHQVDTASNGRQTLALLDQHDFDLVLMDVQMPVMDGFQATTAIRTLDSPKARVPIIAMTAHALKGDQERCLAAGMDGYISKPINSHELVALVERLAAASTAR